MPKPTKQKAHKGKGNAPKPSGSTINDPRFNKMLTDPRFRLPSKKNTRVTLDKRFAHMLKDDDFSKKASVDRYGRKVSKDAGKKELERIYRVEGEDDDEDEDSEKDDDPAADESDEADDDDEVQRELARVDRKYDPARDGGFSSSEDESDDDDVSDEAVEFPNNGNDPQVDEMEEATARIAVVNLDWDNIRATDLMAVASSFTPAEGRILKVTVYPSEFGRERMEREELEGPPREIFSKKKKDDSDSEEDSDSEDERIKQDLLQEDKGEEFDSKALRQYQLERLRYYYALVECDSAATARYLYDNMDGREYLSSANFFDMRFVTDDVSFDEDKPRDECSRVPDGYKPNEFVTDALTHSRVKLTWDADDTTRKEVQKRAFSQKEIDENDLKAYIGTDSSDDESDEAISSDDEAASTTTHDKKKAREEKAAKLRAALGLDSGFVSKKKSNDGPVGDMQITFTSGLSSSNKKTKDDSGKGIFENAPEESTRDKYIRKEKERKQRRKERAKAARTGVISDEQAAAQNAASDAEESALDDNANAAANEENADDDDDPFNDPFFTDPAGETQRAAKAAKKASKQRAAEERAAAATAAAAERAQLELLMADEGADAKLRHFDMKAIEKAEKEARRKGKGKGKKSKKSSAAIDDDEQSGFHMDTADPRFKAVFDSHEYAIDPTNPRFKRTQGMTALLEEGRKKRKTRAERDDPADGDAPLVERGAPAGKKARRSAKDDHDDDGRGGDGANGEDLKKLVEKVKRRTAATGKKGRA
ncbi:pre-rRNA-processing protein ESF1 [Phyllosticta citricarpa]|uniref:Pre-rRNA-processing protein ESF1 n=1 Tax=Phyllosticta citricarpa TaxID=55181 RepID=A0ABR1M6A4_9PEZI